METIKINILDPRAKSLIDDLSMLNLIQIEKTRKPNTWKKFKGILSKDMTLDEVDAKLNKLKESWER